jgi:hypothetical protein
MEDKVVIRDNGREVDANDINTLGESGALADDRVFAELFRMSTGGDIAKGVLPYGEAGAEGQQTVAPGPGARGITVRPFRAFIGIREDADDGKKLWRDIRSCISPSGADVEHDLELAENASADPRWDLVYASVTVDGEVEATRFAKALDSDDVTASAYVTKEVTSMAISVWQGTEAAVPLRPTVPPDGGGIYNVPLAYVLVVPSAIAFTSANIMEVAPVIALASSTSANVTRPASGVSTVYGSMHAQIPWDLTGASRPGLWLPPSMVGGVSLLIPIQLGTGLTPSVLSGDVIDDKIDWRRRFFKWMVYAMSGSVALIASDPALGATNGCPNAPNTIHGTTALYGMGNSFKVNATGNLTPHYEVLQVGSGSLAVLGNAVALYVDTATGELKVYYESGPPAVDAQLFIWLEATAQFPGA